MTVLRALWRGEIRLWVAYWVFGVGGNMSFVLALALLGLGGAGRPSLGLLYLASLAWFVLIFGGVWRSAGRYPGPRLWAVLARLGVSVGVVRMAGEAAYLLG